MLSMGLGTKAHPPKLEEFSWDIPLNPTGILWVCPLHGKSSHLVVSTPQKLQDQLRSGQVLLSIGVECSEISHDWSEPFEDY